MEVLLKRAYEEPGNADGFRVLVVEAVVESEFLLTISWPSNQDLLAMPHRGYGT